MKIITVLGARPQFIKAATLSHAIRKHNEQSSIKIEDIIIHTGQHFDHNMSQVFFDEMKITPPKYSLGVNSSTHGVMTGQMMMQIDEILLKEKPDYVLVYGDTNSTLAGALCAVKLHLPIVHVEAGLRSFNKEIPEEVNRVLTDQISDLLFCPSDRSVEWLKNEGVTKNVFNVGDVMVDSALYFSEQKPSSNVETILSKVKRDFALVTVHRAGNTDNEKNLSEILRALTEISKETDVVFLVHPRTKKRIEALGLDISSLIVHEPVGYTDLLQLLKRSKCVLTDSGGLQKEAYFLEKHCVTLREETEWVELVKKGASTLVGANYDKIMSAYRSSKNKIVKRENVYGDGSASQKILALILQDYSKRQNGRAK